MVNIFSSMMAAMGRQLKQSVNVFHSLMLYRRLPWLCFQYRPRFEVMKKVQHTFVIKTVNSVDACTLVVSTKDEKVFRVLDLVCEEKANGFEGLFTPVDVVAEEEVVCFWGKTPILEESQEVIVLTMDVTCRAYRWYESQQAYCRMIIVMDEPQILMGASSSNRMGWFMKISRAFVQRYLISYSCSCTGLPGRFPRTVIKKEG